MTASNTPDQRIDEIRQTLTQVIMQAHKQISDYQNRKEPLTNRKIVDEATQQLKSLFETMANDVIGIPNYETYEQTVIAQFQDEQRQRIPQVISKYFNTEEK